MTGARPAVFNARMLTLMPDLAGAGQLIHTAWQRLSPLPAGKWLFSRLLGLANPYTGSVGPHVLELRPGSCRVEICDRRAVRNHVRSVHALAIANIAEIATGLSLMASLPSDARTILVSLSVDYLHKARGRLVSECRHVPPPPADAVNYDVELESTVTDSSGEVVARGHARWRVSPKRMG